MSFTDRFIKLPVRIYDKKAKDLTGVEDLEDSWEKINPFEISNYRPAYPSEDEELNCTNVMLKNGEAILTYLSVPEFEKLLNSFTNQ